MRATAGTLSRSITPAWRDTPRPRGCCSRPAPSAPSAPSTATVATMRPSTCAYVGCSSRSRPGRHRSRRSPPRCGRRSLPAPPTAPLSSRCSRGAPAPNLPPSPRPPDSGQRMIHQVLAFSLQISHFTWTESLLKLIGSSFVLDLLSLKRSSRQTGKTGRKLEVAVDDMENLARACKVCKCEELQKILDKEVVHQKYAEYKSAKELDLDNSQKRFILQAQSLPKEDRLPSALQRILQTCLANSREGDYSEESNEMIRNSEDDDLADLYIKVGDKVFHCHQVILASRSEYFRARLSRTVDFLDGNSGFQAAQNVPLLEEHDLSAEAFEKMLEYMYTDKLEHLDPDQAEELFDVASRYLLFPLKRVVADMLLPYLEHVSPAELCHWLMLSDIYGVMKIREYILDIIACNFEMFADTREFRALLLTLPPPSGDDSLRTTRPSAPGTGGNTDQGNILDDLREKWLEAEGAELDERDESAALFDRRLEMLMLVAEKEADDVDA
ncbi:BTB/POZ domain-containing protein At2g04740 isoform X2 [Sorghum bicolor]|nr:BTB/POZ domain-containing protein At2g04740 isoform X2 [Sorghum bicolor]|eukprot:XP_021306088.1 BTB/POZ domain-containing protein At2g04740 isoform X2 [Sorghum bicolor]